MPKESRSESIANQLMAANTRSKQVLSDAYGQTPYDRMGRNALTYYPTLRNARTAPVGAFSRIVAAIVNALL